MSRAFLQLPLRAVLTAALLTGAGCGGDDDGGNNDGSGGVDAGSDGCDETSLLPAGFRPIGSVSTGDLTTETADGVTDAVIDASAGGLDGAADNPYLYIDLESGGTKVDIDDVEALDSDEWDLAFKRASIKANGGDSGTAGVEVAAVADVTLEELTEAPDDGDFVADDWASDDCQFQSLPVGEPATAFGEWYDYDKATHVLTPKTEVYVVRTRSGDLVKVAIETYYGDEAEPMRGAIYRASWAPL
jgi:HmuY protein